MLEVTPDGIGLEGAALGWTWNAVRGVRVFGGRGPTTLEITLSDGRIEAFGSFLPPTASDAWSQARVRRLAEGLAERAGVALVDENPPVEELLARAVESLRALAEPTRASHRAVFVSDRYPAEPTLEETPEGTVILMDDLRIRVTRTHVYVGQSAWALSDIAAVDLMVVQEQIRQTRKDPPTQTNGVICAVHKGRREVLLTCDISRHGALQTHWLAQQLDRAAAAVPFDAGLEEVPDSVLRLVSERIRTSR
ncbi:MAG: hypothetical protein H6737_08385 [Alphaproteobacteria bacterium]|nr:hypothetical protein [Alphaproteobacteria bacterium]